MRRAPGCGSLTVRLSGSSAGFARAIRPPGGRFERGACPPPSLLADDAAAHHADLVARDVAGSVRGEEDAGIRDFLGAPETAERNLPELLWRAGRRLAKFRIPFGVPPLGVHGPGDDHVRADPEGAKLRGQRANQAQ